MAARSPTKLVSAHISLHAPALAVLRGDYVAAWTSTGQGNLHIIRSRDGQGWSLPVSLPETSESSPALAVFEDALYIAWRGKGDDRLNVMWSADGIRWQNQNKVTLNDTTTSGPALVAYGKKLHLAWRGKGNNNLNVIEGNIDSHTDRLVFANKVTLKETTLAAPYLHVHVAWLTLSGRESVTTG